MSSSGFPRSRARARQQRASKAPCYAHPRFLQLVKELARLDDIKKKRDETEHPNHSSGTTSAPNTMPVSLAGSSCLTSNEPAPTPSNLQHTTSHHRHPHHQHHSPHHSHYHSQHQQRGVIDCWPVNASISSSGCCNSSNEAHHGCRSLECNRATSALNDSYYRQNSSNDNPHMLNHGLHPQQHYHHQRHYNYSTSNHQGTLDGALNDTSHNAEQDYRCPSKCISTSSGAQAGHANIGYSKSGLVVQATDTGNADFNHRQDENRSKRKRSNNESSSSGKKISPSLSPSSYSKRHKSSPEPTRPLSPSFTKCPICLLDCMDRDPSFTNTCFHLFCFVCIENWSRSKATCPLCRTKFTKIVYNIKSASCFDEKVASPIRRDDDDDRLIYEQLHGLNANALGAARTSTSEEARLIFENLRHTHNHVLSSQFALVDHSFNRHMSSLQNYNSVANNSNFNSSVPPIPFTTSSYNLVGPNLTALLASNDRSQVTINGPAISSAYTSDVVNSDSSNRRMPRNPRFHSYSRPHDSVLMDGSTRISRSTSTDLNQSGASQEPRHHHGHHNHQLQQGTLHQHHDHHNQQPQLPHHRPAATTVELGPRQSQRVSLTNFFPYLPVQAAARQYVNPNPFSRRPFPNPSQSDQHMLYRQMPDS